MPNKQTVVITGGSSGIGLATAKLFADNGFSVFSLSRSAPDDIRITHISTDVSSEDSVKEAFNKIKNSCVKLDILINNAGFGISGATELTTVADAKRLFDVNFFGTFLCSKYAAPLLRESKGIIINVSSAAAIFSIPYQSFYSASKAAVNSLSLAIKNELLPFNVRVCTVMPGDVKTGFTSARKKDNAQNSIYSDTVGPSVSVMEKDEENGMSPQKIAARIFSLSKKQHPKPLTVVGGKYKLFALLNKLLPARFVNYVVGKMYIKKTK